MVGKRSLAAMAEAAAQSQPDNGSSGGSNSGISSDSGSGSGAIGEGSDGKEQIAVDFEVPVPEAKRKKRPGEGISGPTGRTLTAEQKERMVHAKKNPTFLTRDNSRHHANVVGLKHIHDKQRNLSERTHASSISFFKTLANNVTVFRAGPANWGECWNDPQIQQLLREMETNAMTAAFPDVPVVPPVSTTFPAEAVPKTPATDKIRSDLALYLASADLGEMLVLLNILNSSITRASRQAAAASAAAAAVASGATTTTITAAEAAFGSVRSQASDEDDD